jgi:predicted nucleic acid-binding protein
MKLVDTSILVPVFRDRTGAARDRFKRDVGSEYVLTRFTQIELLWGCRSEEQWHLFSDYLDGQEYVEAQPETWTSAARIYFDLRRGGLTVASILDCCIAQIAIENGLTIVHNDKDFETIGKIRRMRSRRIDIQARG